MEEAERLAVFLRIADLELNKGPVSQGVSDAEVRRVAIELEKLHRAGHFPDIAEAGLLVGLIHLFEARVIEPASASQSQRGNELNE
jgi:hypothetical protein